MNYIVRTKCVDLRTSTFKVACYGVFNDPTSARDFAWDKLRATAKKLKEALNCSPNNIPDSDLFYEYEQTFYSDTHKTCMRVTCRVEEMNEVKCDIIQPNNPSQQNLL